MRCACIYFLILLAGESCDSQKKESPAEKSITVGSLTMTVPFSLEYTKASGLDSYVAYLIANKKDTFHIEYGGQKIIYDLFPHPPMAVSENDGESMRKNLGKLPEDVVVSKYYKNDNLQNIFDKNFYTYDTINSIVVKVVQPKRTGTGMTGCYIPELKDGNSFCIYAENLDSATQSMGFRIFRSIKYK